MASPLDLFRRLSNGVYIVGVAHDGRRNAFTSAWITQVSFDPLLLMLSINPEHYSYPLLTGARGFAVTILQEGQLDLVEHFGLQSGRDTDKLAGQPWRESAGGFPVLTTGVAWVDCVVDAQHFAGDHVLVLARVTGGELLDPTRKPLLYRDTGNIDGSAALFPPSFPPR